MYSVVLTLECIPYAMTAAHSFSPPPFMATVKAVYNTLFILLCKCHQIAAEQLLPRQTIQSGKAGGMDRPSQYKPHLPGHSPPAKLGRTPCRGAALDNASSGLFTV